VKRTTGGASGYSGGMVRERAKEPPAKGVLVGGVMTAVRAVILGGWVNHTAKWGAGTSSTASTL